MTAAQSNFLTPATFTLYLSINILVLVIFGGMGSIFGVVFGAIAIQTITMYLIHTPPAGYQPQDLYIYLGALLVIMMIFRPAGLFPARRRQRVDVSTSSFENSND
jgi:branched-chain amino acid transport system permease protein